MKKEKLENSLQVNQAALIEKDGERGIVFKIGENLSATWQSGDVIVFWENGEQTIIPDEFELVSKNVFRKSVTPKKAST